LMIKKACENFFKKLSEYLEEYYWGGCNKVWK
jgi:hypothetical protein